MILLLLALLGLTSATRCVNFYGLETERRDLVCSWVNPPRFYLTELKNELNVTRIRVPVSYEYVIANNLTNLDELFHVCMDLNISIILDMHRIWDTHQSAIPEDGIQRDEFLRVWEALLDRYNSFDVLIGVGFFNEIQHDDPIYTQALYDQMIPYIDSRYGHGRFDYYLGCHTWASNCTGLKLDGDNTFFEIHAYPFSHVLEWDEMIPVNISGNRIFVGEVGFKSTEVNWAVQFFGFLHRRDIDNVCFWTISNSGDTGGLWEDDCVTKSTIKWELIKYFL